MIKMPTDNQKLPTKNISPALFKYLSKNLSFAALKQKHFIENYFIYKIF